MFDVTLTKMATFEKNRPMSIAMNNHNLSISGQCGTGKHVLLRNKPKENVLFYSNQLAVQARRKQSQIGGGGAHIKQLQIGGAHIFFFKMTDLCNGGWGGGGIFVQIIGGARPPVPPYSYGPAVYLSL